MADTLARADGREIRLEEEPTLALALLLPEDGYSCEVIRGVPPGLAEFLLPLQRDGLCRMAPQPTSSGFWTIYMIDHHNNVRIFLISTFYTERLCFFYNFCFLNILN